MHAAAAKAAMRVSNGRLKISGNSRVPLEANANAATAAATTPAAPTKPATPNEVTGTRAREQIAIEDAWLTMLHFTGASPRGDDQRFVQTFVYAPGDVVEVRGNNLEWLPGIVTFSPTHKEDTPIGTDLKNDDLSSDDHVQAQIRAIFEFLESDDRLRAGITKEQHLKAVHPLEEKLVELNLSASAVKEHQEEFVNVIRPSGNVELGRDALEVRVHGTATRVLWGEAPFLWQQWALLKAERYMRFEEHHPDDFAEVEWQTWARALFFEWLNDGRADDEAPRPDDPNAKFWRYWRSFDRHPGAQAALLDHLLEPFALIDTVNGWNFDDSAISCYTYLSMHGTGWASGLAVLFVQFAIPLILREDVLKELLNCFWDVGGPWNWSRHKPFFHDCRDVASSPGHESPEHQGPESPEHQGPEGSPEWSRYMLVCIVVIYLTQVVPDQWLRIKVLFGNTRTPRSWLTNLRQSVWDKNQDTDLQKIGYMIELNMNTLYVVALYTLNILMIINETESVDILLNALAIEFVHRIDEEIVLTGSFDPGWRHMRAGTVEMVMRRYLNFQLLERLKHDPRYNKTERSGLSEGVSCASPRKAKRSPGSQRILAPFQNSSSPNFQGQAEDEQMSTEYYEALASLAKRRTEHRWYPAYGMFSKVRHRLGLPTKYIFRKHWQHYLAPPAGKMSINWNKVLYQHSSNHFEHVMRKEIASSLFDDEPTTHESLDYTEPSRGHFRTHMRIRQRYRLLMHPTNTKRKSVLMRAARIVVFVGLDTFLKLITVASQYLFPVFLCCCIMFAL